MAGYEDYFDNWPERAQFYDEDHGGSENEIEQMFSAFSVMVGFAFISQAPLFTRAAVVEGTVVGDGQVIVNGTKYWGLTVAEAEEVELRMMLNEQLGAAAPIPVAVNDLLKTSALIGMKNGEGLFDAAALAFLFNYSNDPQGTGSDWGSWHDYIQRTGGGHVFCVTWGDPPLQSCYWEYD